MAHLAHSVSETLCAEYQCLGLDRPAIQKKCRSAQYTKQNLTPVFLLLALASSFQ